MPPLLTLTRRVRFSAAHRYHRPEWSAERNRAVFGEDVALHGHNYVLEATVTGELDPVTGMAADLATLDAALGEIAGRLGWRDLGQDVPELAGSVPTTENVALVAWRGLEGRTGLARLVRLRLFESPELYVELHAEAEATGP